MTQRPGKSRDICKKKLATTQSTINNYFNKCSPTPSLACIIRQPELTNGPSDKDDGSNGTIDDRCAPLTGRSAVSHLSSENMSEAAIIETQEDENPFIIRNRNRNKK